MQQEQNDVFQVLGYFLNGSVYNTNKAPTDAAGAFWRWNTNGVGPGPRFSCRKKPLATGERFSEL
jgi:hypothetical protein